MDPVTMMAISAAIQLGSAALAEWLSGGDSDEERRLRQDALAQYAAIAPPEAQEVIARTVEGTAMDDVRRDDGQEAIRDEMQGRLLERVRGGGMDAQSQARYEQARQRSAMEARAGRQGALSRAGVRGLGPEAALTDMLLAQQGSAESERMAGLQQAADADRAALESLLESGSMAGERSRERWSQDASVAQARDDMRRFNAGQMSDADRFNAGQKNWAWDAEYKRRAGLAGANQDMADSYGNRAQQTRQRVGGVGQGLAYGVNSLGASGGIPSSGTPASRTATPYEAANPGAIGSSAALPDDELRKWRATQQTTPTTRRAR